MVPKAWQSVTTDWVCEKVDTGLEKHSDTMVSVLGLRGGHDDGNDGQRSPILVNMKVETGSEEHSESRVDLQDGVQAGKGFGF